MFLIDADLCCQATNLFSAAGLSTSNVFMAGHSLGGVVLESYIKDHPELASGIILFGSYLPGGWVGSDDNIFPVPVSSNLVPGYV